MEIKHRDLIVDTDNPFANCKLNRQQYAAILTDIVESYAEGFVLAINNKWGTGKTTFVKMWERFLQKRGYLTMHFNAWENDFEMEALAAMLGELKKLIGKKEDKTFKLLVEKAATISKRILPSIAKNTAKKYLGEEVSELISNSVEAATDILNDEVEEYINKKDNLAAFREQLDEFIKENGKGKPVVFIIDELDRCRPDYAVEVLEKVKHFFSVPGIIFVLSIDKKQLGYAIQGYYGSANIDTDEYLRRFIDLEYQLPKPNVEDFSKYLFQYYGFKEFFTLDNRRTDEIRYEREEFLSFCILLGETFHYTLRQYEKLFAHARIVLRTFPSGVVIRPNIVLFLIHLKLFDDVFYNNIKTKRIDIQECIDRYENIFNLDVDDRQFNRIVYTEASLIYLYNEYYHKDAYNYRVEHPLLIKNGEKENDLKLAYSSKTNGIPNMATKTSLENAIKNVEARRYDYSTGQLSYYLDRVEMLNNIVGG